MTQFVSSKILLSAALLLPLAACAVPGKHSSKVLTSACPNGSTFVDVKYGDSYLKVNPKANVKRNAAFEFRLKPKKGYEGKQVTISGKTADDAWIQESGSYSARGRSLSVCVPPNQAYGDYYYFVEVADVGKLDPRADVTR